MRNLIYLANFEVGKFRPVYYKFNAKKMKFSIKDFFGKCDQIRRILKTEENIY